MTRITLNKVSRRHTVKSVNKSIQKYVSHDATVTRQTDLRLVGRERDVDLLHRLDALGSEAVADLLEAIIGANLRR